MKTIKRLTICKKIQAEHGQSLVELAVILPLLLLMLAGVLDMGRSMHAYVVMLNASREAAVMGAATEVETSTLNTVAKDELMRGGLSPDLATVTVEYQPRGFPAEDHIIVQVDYTLPLMLAVLSVSNVNLSSRTEMVVFW